MSFRSGSSNEFLSFFASEVQQPMHNRAPATTNSHHRPKPHVRFINEEKVIEVPRRPQVVTQYVVQEDVDDEAAAFIKMEHTKFQMRQMTMSDY